MTDVQNEFNANHPEAMTWSYWGDIDTPLALHVPNKLKQHSVEDIRNWYASQGVTIPSEQVYFFGDRVENIQPFAELGFNSREISCDSRDDKLYGGSGMVGFCGATPEEVIRKQGNYNCDDDHSNTAQPTPGPPPSSEWVPVPALRPTPPPTGFLPPRDPSLAPLPPMTCQDTAEWSNGFNCRAEGHGSWVGCSSSGWTCEGYRTMGWCKDGKRLVNWAFGSGLNRPETNCCECGGGSYGACSGPTVSRRRRAESMCSCRRRSGQADLDAGWACRGDYIGRIE